MTRSVIIIGGPDSGKTNYIGRLWRALDEQNGKLYAVEQPEDINFVMEVTDHLFRGDFAPRSEHSDARRDFKVIVANQTDGPQSTVIVPDVSGELWRNAVIDNEISKDWITELKNSDAAILFIRVGSDQDVRPLDWVTSRSLLQTIGGADASEIPTQVMLCELIHFLEDSLIYRSDGGLPRLSVVVSAWDLVDKEKFELGPVAYLEREYPLVAGRISDLKNKLDVQVFGLSVVGGDLRDDLEYRDSFLQVGLDGQGWVVAFNGTTWQKESDVTLPVAWAIGL